MKKSNNDKTHIKYTIIFTLTVVGIMTLAMLTVWAGITFLFYSPVFGKKHIPPHMSWLIYSILSIFWGAGLSVVFSRIIIRPLDKLIDALNHIIEGDYSVRVRPEGIRRSRNLAKRFNHMAEELQSIETLSNDFIGNFSHEFKTPVTSILGFAKLLKTEELSPAKKAAYLDIIIEESEKLASLSATALLFSKIENWDQPGEKTVFNLSESIRKAVVLLEPKWSEKNIDMGFDGDEITINGCEALLEHVWRNILDNAVKFSPVGSSVEICLTKENDIVFIKFIDNGKGMDENDIAKAFDKFYQSDHSHACSGNGLGLPLSKKIVELHNGTVSISSKPDVGTTVTISLPLNCK